MDAVPHWPVGDPAPPPLPVRSEADIVARWQDGPPLVSVLCPTYQHVDFIEDALRGFLGQNTDFPFEVIVRDDGSNDGTAEIVREYAERFPGIIRAICEPVNTFPAALPHIALREASCGALVAICEGDDYWISPDKLQRQADVLRGRPDVSVCVNAGITIADGRIITPPNRLNWTELSAQQLRTATVVGLRTTCFRAAGLAPWSSEGRFINLDQFIFNRLGMAGGAVRLHDLVATVFRVHSGGIWSGMERREQLIQRATTHYWLGAYFSEQDDPRSSAHHLSSAATLLQRSHLEAGVDPRPRMLVDLLRSLPSMLVRRFRAATRRGGRRRSGIARHDGMD